MVKPFLSLICHNTFTCKQCNQNSHCPNGFKLRFVSRVGVLLLLSWKKLGLWFILAIL
jgi:Cys-rich repeat protein